MSRRGAVLAGCVLLAASIAPPAHAIIPRTTRRPIADELTAMPAAGVTKPLRAQRMVRAGSPATIPWQRFAATGTWSATWDAATAVPSRIWGSGIAAPGASTSAAIAESVARKALADHIALLAPGAAASDFVLVSNHDDGDIRSVGFVQRARGRRVVGGQVSFRFKRDRLFVIGSEALPAVAFAEPRARIARSALHARATTTLRDSLELPAAPVSAPGDEVVLPLVADDAVLGYRLAVPLVIDGGADGKYLAYVDPESAAVLAVHQQNRYATGTLLYRTVDRHPGKGRADRPASRAQVMIGATAVTTTVDGTVTWTPDTAMTLTTSIVGDLVKVVTKGATGVASAQLPIMPGGQVVWDATANTEHDSQVVVFVATNAVKEYVRANIDPNMRDLDMQMTANVNIPQSCNAFYDGSSINFFRASTQCQNSGLLEDVVYHEFGHALHHHEVIEGVGAFDGAMSEGAADFLSAIITGDPGIGRGLFYDETPLRQLDPAGGEEFIWPRDITNLHNTGRIYGGALWDLRKALLASMGNAAAVALTNRLYVATLRRAVGISTSLIEVLAADDDDGNLANGTPHECVIRDAFGRHGLRNATGRIDGPALLTGDATETTVRLELTGLSSCPADAIDTATLVWVPSLIGLPAAGTRTMTAAGPAAFTAALPLPADAVLFYAARVRFTDGTITTLADNLANPFYEVYQGDTVPLYCTTFDADPFAEGWTTGTADGAASPWQWGAPAGGATDPPSAFAGASILATNLAGNYPAMATSWVALPPLDAGTWSDVRLQYRRWLTVEDSQFDKAEILVNEKQAWINVTANRGNASQIHHLDREWRFHDVPVSGFGFGTGLDIRFSLIADAGKEFGGWQIDELCVVANIHSVCGDGVKSPTEQCDAGDANADAPNACRTYCKSPVCGDGIVDTKEECDEGPAGTADCSAMCIDLRPPSEDGGCCSGSVGSRSALPLAGLVGFALLRRRRTRSARVDLSGANCPSQRDSESQR